MKKSTENAKVMFNVALSSLVDAASCRQAIERANFQMNEESVRIDQLDLVDELGKSKGFKVEQLASIEWTGVQYSESTSQFRVFGYIRLLLNAEISTDQDEMEFQKTAYRFPRSVLQDQSIWVIPTWGGPVFSEVLSQSFVLSSSAKKSAFLAG